jgi:hypothetical protein
MIPTPHALLSLEGGSMGKRRRRRRRVEPTDDWKQLKLLCTWDEQREYERIRPLVLFGTSILERAVETGEEAILMARVSCYPTKVTVGELAVFGSLLAYGGDEAQVVKSRRPEAVD